MFRKDFEVKPAANIKSSEKRKIHQAVNTQVNAFKVPEKLSKAVFNTRAIKKGTVYYNAENNDPVMIQFRDELRFVPTLQGLWLSSNPCLPTIQTHDFVIEKLMNGANLMIRGCMGHYGLGLKPNAYVAVVNYKNPTIPVAVGICQMDLENKQEDNVPNTGVAVEIITVVGDDLWRLGRSFEDISKEVADSIATVDENKKELVLETSEIPDLGSINLEKEDDIVSEAASDAKDCKDDICISLEESENTGHETDESEKPYIMKTEDIDEMFKRAVLYTLSQDTLDFPILASQFISGYVLKNLPPVDTDLVNMKKTSWKKTTKFLKAMEKDNLLKLKGKDDSLSVVSAAQKDDPRIAEFVPYRIKQSSENRSSSTLAPNSVVPPILVNIYLKPKKTLRGVFDSTGHNPDEYYTEKELKRIAQKYIDLNPSCVSTTDPQKIVPDDNISLLGIKKTIKRAEFIKIIIDECSPFYTIHRDGDENSTDVVVQKRLIPKKGDPPKIKIRIENPKVGRKVITLITGCEYYYIDVNKLANTLKVKCSGSSTITDGATPKDCKTIMVQGKHDASAIDILQNQWGVSPRFCLIENKTKGKGRRK